MRPKTAGQRRSSRKKRKICCSVRLLTSQQCKRISLFPQACSSCSSQSVHHSSTTTSRRLERGKSYSNWTDFVSRTESLSRKQESSFRPGSRQTRGGREEFCLTLNSLSHSRPLDQLVQPWTCFQFERTSPTITSVCMSVSSVSEPSPRLALVSKLDPVIKIKSRERAREEENGLKQWWWWASLARNDRLLSPTFIWSS